MFTQTITSNLYEEPFACTDSEVILTCVTTGSQALTWTSEEYIGLGNVGLGFVAGINRQGDMLTSSTHPSTVASFTNVVNNGGVYELLESTLRFMVSLDQVNSSVTCIDEQTNERDTLFIHVLGK